MLSESAASASREIFSSRSMLFPRVPRCSGQTDSETDRRLHMTRQQTPHAVNRRRLAMCATLSQSLSELSAPTASAAACSAGRRHIQGGARERRAQVLVKPSGQACSRRKMAFRCRACYCRCNTTFMMPRRLQRSRYSSSQESQGAATAPQILHVTMCIARNLT